MKSIVAAAALLCAGLLTSVVAEAQTAATPFTGGQRKEAAPRKRKASAQDVSRMQQRMSMNPNEVKRDQQLEVLEARSGVSSSYSSSGSRQYEKGNGGFTVRQFRDKRSAALQKRGQTRPAPGIDPKGKPLKHKNQRKGFLGL